MTHERLDSRIDSFRKALRVGLRKFVAVLPPRGQVLHVALRRLLDHWDVLEIRGRVFLHLPRKLGCELDGLGLPLEALVMQVDVLGQYSSNRDQSPYACNQRQTHGGRIICGNGFHDVGPYTWLNKIQPLKSTLEESTTC